MSYDENDPFHIPFHDLEEAKRVLEGTHELQIQFKKLFDESYFKNHIAIKNLSISAAMIGYPTMLERFAPF